MVGSGTERYLRVSPKVARGLPSGYKVSSDLLQECCHYALLVSFTRVTLEYLISVPASSQLAHSPAASKPGAAGGARWAALAGPDTWPLLRSFLAGGMVLVPEQNEQD